MHISKEAHASLIDEIIRRDTLDYDVTSEKEGSSVSGGGAQMISDDDRTAGDD